MNLDEHFLIKKDNFENDITENEIQQSGWTTFKNTNRLKIKP